VYGCVCEREREREREREKETAILNTASATERSLHKKRKNTGIKFILIYFNLFTFNEHSRHAKQQTTIADERGPRDPGERTEESEESLTHIHTHTQTHTYTHTHIYTHTHT